MKPARLVLTTTVVLCLTLAIAAQQPQKAPAPQNQQQVDPDPIEAAHSELLNAKDKAAEASRLTQAVSPALPVTAATGVLLRPTGKDNA